MFPGHCFAEIQVELLQSYMHFERNDARIIFEYWITEQNPSD